MSRSVQPGLLRLFRYFAGVGVVYFAILWAYASINIETSSSMLPQSGLNLFTNALLFVYLSLSWLEKKMGRFYLPFALVAYTLATVLSGAFYLADPAPTMQIFLTRSWSLVPILLIPLVFIAWQYGPHEVMFFNLFANVTEMVLSFLVVRQISFATLPFLTLPIVRAFAFGIVGHIVTILVNAQRQQTEKLIQANVRLSHYANTMEQLTISRERNRIARELHDTLAHTLSGVAVNLEATKTMLKPDDSDVSTMLDHSLSAVRLGLNETRRVLQNLRAQPLEDLGLAGSVRWLLQNLVERDGVTMNVVIVDKLPALPAKVEQAFFRVAQEALENISRHANATHVEFVLQPVGRQMKLEISDDGQGMRDAEAAGDLHFGIKGMRERAEAIGAVFALESKSDEGTKISLIWEGIDDQSIDL